MGRSSRVLQHGNQKSWFFSKKFKIDEIELCPLSIPKKRNRPGFVDISPTLVIDTSMERSSRVLLHKCKHKNSNFFKNFEIEFRLVFWLVRKRWNHSSRSQHEPIWWHRGCIVPILSATDFNLLFQVEKGTFYPSRLVSYCPSNG